MNELDKYTRLHPAYVEVLEKLRWAIIEYEDDMVCLEKYSPAGEDFIAYISTIDFPKSVYIYAENFDVDEHVEMWIPSRGKGGCPSSISDLVDDAKAIEEMLYDLFYALKEVVIE